MPTQEIAAFHVAFAAHRDELYSWDLWGAAYLLMGGCSDDCFTDFRSWIVAQGQAYFEAVRSDPQALADGRLEDGGHALRARYPRLSPLSYW